jgi:hypothetical protein
LYTSEILAYFGAQKARGDYEQFVGLGVDEELSNFYQHPVAEAVLGSDEFKDGLKIEQDATEIPQIRALLRPPEMDAIIEIVARAFSMPPNQVVQRPRGNEASVVCIALCRRPGGHSLRVIAERFGLGNYSSVTATCKRLPERLATNRGLFAK